MKPEAFFQSQRSKPTFEQMVQDILSMGVDRASVVRPRNGDKPCCIAVFMLSPDAVRDLGPYLRAHLEKLNLVGNTLSFSINNRFASLWEDMIQIGQPWLICKFTIDDADCHAAFIVGDSITEEFARGLTNRGATTNLK